MKRFVIVTNKTKDPGLAVTERISSFLTKAGALLRICGEDTAGSNWKTLFSEEEEKKWPECCILVLGGDGTMLRTARETAGSGAYVLGVNLGTLGYLAEVEKQQVERALSQLLEGSYEVEERMMLHGQVVRDREVIEDIHALNDVAIIRSGSLQMIHFQISVNGKLLRGYHADGIIVATPTGSTGYNMSAGGPIVEPGARLLLLTPICPHTLQSRSVVLREDDRICIEIGERDAARAQQVEASFDGSRSVTLKTGDRVWIERSERTTSILKLSEASFLDVLHRKMNG